jgi:hypothetical protein
MGGAGAGSASSFSISVATLKKLSARRKNPSFARLTLFPSVRKACNSECDCLVSKLKFLVPPSGLNPQLVAIASRSVDLPLPFSPTMKVTLGCSFRVPSSFTAGSENG